MAKLSLVRIRGQWVEIHADEIAALLLAVGTKGEATVGDVIRTGLGLPSITEPGGARVVGATATGRLGELLSRDLGDRVASVGSPDGFSGTLRPYQARGVGWLRFLGQLGLGACLADDMGLGKTAQLIGHRARRPTDEPTLVVCPTSVIGNWERELARFAPDLRVLVHHGAQRTDTRRRSQACAGHDVVLTSYGLLAARCRDRREIELGAAGARRGAAGEEPAHGAGQGRAAGTGRRAHRDDRHAGGEPTQRAVGDDAGGQPWPARLDDDVQRAVRDPDRTGRDDEAARSAATVDRHRSCCDG